MGDVLTHLRHDVMESTTAEISAMKSIAVSLFLPIVYIINDHRLTGFMDAVKIVLG
jgi:hypothetical protein